jgi:hypothetical protein
MRDRRPVRCRSCNTSTGDVELAGGSSQDTGCTVENATGNLICTGDAPAGGVLLRTTGSGMIDTQTLTTATDWDNLTLGGLLTATGGATLTGALNINTTGSSATIHRKQGHDEGYNNFIGNATTSDLVPYSTTLQMNSNLGRRCASLMIPSV